MHRFFISFASEDQPVTDFLARTLNHLFQGHGRFFASAGGLDSGDRWLECLKDEIASADAVLVLLGPNSVLSPWVNIEVGAFWASDKTIHPLVHGGVQPKDLHRPLADFQVLDVSTSDGVARLVELLAKRVGMVAPPAYDAAAISRSVSALDHKALRTIDSWEDVAQELETLSAEPRWEQLRTYDVYAELGTVSWRLISDTVLQVSGYSDDSMLLTLTPSEPFNAARFLVIKLSNSSESVSFADGVFLKMVFAGEVLYPYFKFSRHPKDSQFIARADGYYVYELFGAPASGRSDLLFVFWRAAVNRVRLELALVA